MARYPIKLGVVRRMLRDMIRYMIELREGKKFVRRFLRYSIELRVVRSLLENVRYLIGFVVVRRMLGEM